MRCLDGLVRRSGRLVLQQLCHLLFSGFFTHCRVRLCPLVYKPLLLHSFGMAASMGAFLLGAGAKGKRRALPNSRIMIHQPLGGAQGQAADIEIQVRLQ